MHATKPFRPAMIANINRLDVNVGYARSPDGRTFAKSMRVEVKGRAFMKKSANASHVLYPICDFPDRLFEHEPVVMTPGGNQVRHPVHKDSITS